MLIIVIVVFVLVISIVTLVIVLNKSSGSQAIDQIDFKLQSLTSEVSRIENAVKTEIATNRRESSEAAKGDREELANSFSGFRDFVSSLMNEMSKLQKEQLQQFSENLTKLILVMEEKHAALTNAIEGKLSKFEESTSTNSKEGRAELKQNLEKFQEDFSKSIASFNATQRDNFFALLNKQDDQNKATTQKMDQMRSALEEKFTALQSGNEQKLEQMRTTVETKIVDMQTGNEKKLEEMRATVDEKLQKTLESRLGESFKLVSERLEAVHKGLGDMQQLPLVSEI